MTLATFTVVVTLLVVAYLLATSVYVLRPDTILASFFISTYRRTYVSGTYVKVNGPPVAPNKRGIWGSDIVFLLYPIWRGVHLPTSGVVLRYHAARVYTKEGFPISMDATAIATLSENLAALVHRFSVLGRRWDLARNDMITYHVDRDPGTQELKTQTYRSPCLAQVLVDDTTTIVLEALRKVAATLTWEEIKAQLDSVEKLITYELAAPESLFAQGGLLERRAISKVEGFPGSAVREFDFNLEDVSPQDPKLMEAFSQPAIAKEKARAAVHEAKAARLAGVGEGKRISAVVAETGGAISHQEILWAETAKDIGQNLFKPKP